MLLVPIGCGQNSLNTKNSENKTGPVVKSDVQELNLKGNVKTLKQEEYLASEPNKIIGKKTGLNSFFYKFDDKGNKIEESFLDKEGIPKETSEFKFLADGKKSQKIISNMDNEVVSSYDYTYNDLSQISKITKRELSEEFEYYAELKYDANGNEVSYSMRTMDGTLIGSSESAYTDGMLTKFTLKESSGSPSAIVEYEYNENGDRIKEIFYTGNNMIFEEYHMEYEYDDNQNWIQMKYFLDKIHMASESNQYKKLGVQTITMRTITYQ